MTEVKDRIGAVGEQSTDRMYGIDGVWSMYAYASMYGKRVVVLVH